MNEKLPSWLDGPRDRLIGLRGALPHALLVHGPAGIGKRLLVDAFVDALLCEQSRADGRACGTCAACGWRAQGHHPDLRLLTPGADDEEGKEKASRDIRIAQVRALGDFLAVGAHRGGRKVVIVDPADALNVPAANALLKTLEEPPGDTVFLLVTSRADALPATIRSRCVAQPVPLPPEAAALEWLLDALRAAGTPDVAQARTWLAVAGGAPLRALALAEPSEAAAHRLILKTVAAFPDNSIIQAADALAAVPPGTWLPLLQAWVADLGRVAAGAAPKRFPGHAERLQRLARSTTLGRLAGFDAWLARQLPATGHPLNPRLFCEDTLLRYAAIYAAH